MKLAAFLTLARRTRTDFAVSIGVTPGAITGYCNGSLWPKRDVMQRIVAETNGAVTANDFLPPTVEPNWPDTANQPF